METEFICNILLALCGLASGIYAYIMGRKKRKTTKALSESEQRADLRDYMISEVESAEKTARLFPKSEKLSTWKKDTVLKNVSLYAQGQGYSWYNKEEWSNNIDNYVKGTKKVNYNGVQ